MSRQGVQRVVEVESDAAAVGGWGRAPTKVWMKALTTVAMFTEHDASWIAVRGKPMPAGVRASRHV